MKRHLNPILLAGLLCMFATSARALEPVVEVYKSPTCGCCQLWVDHLRDAGFEVSAHDVSSVAPLKQKLGVPAALGSCHTAVVGGYVIEGHVPAADVQRLLKTRPDIVGLAVPGMPMGSPGMEFGPPVAYHVLAIGRDGSTSVFASHGQ